MNIQTLTFYLKEILKKDYNLKDSDASYAEHYSYQTGVLDVQEDIAYLLEHGTLKID